MAFIIIRRHIPILLLGAAAVFGQVSRPVVDTRIAAQSTSSALPDRKVAPNDLLSITVFDEPEVSRPAVRVGSDGTVIIPVLPKPLSVAGLLPREIEALVSKSLMDAEILVHPTVSVAILEYAYEQISIQGQVRIPGQFNITEPISLFEALAKAGGVTPDAGSLVLVSKTATDIPQKIDLSELQKNPQPSTNITLTGGELISVPDAPKLFVTGNVAKPGPIPVKTPDDATVLKAVADAGGLTQYYNKTAYIYRADATGKRQEIAVPLQKLMHREAQDVTLMADDILLIPDDNGYKRRQLLQTLQAIGGTASSALVYYGLQHH
ncbi:MAG TPA: polysaccharide biosynthesis/export family protein [Bryobacteraceae bacterium]|jgi:polysaccharide export outer membrane protein